MKHRIALACAIVCAIVMGAPRPQAAKAFNIVVTASPTPAPTGAPGVAVLDGCNMYTAGDWFNNSVLTVESTSAQQITSYTAADTAPLKLQIQTTWHVNIASSPVYYTDSNSSGHPALGGFPWGASYVVSEHNSDDHGETLVTAGAPNGCIAYGGYWGNGNVNVGTNTIRFYADQRENMGGTLVAGRSTNALDMAGGIAVIPGMLVYSQYAATGAFNHALVLVVKANATCTGNAVAPATGDGGLTYNGPGADAAVCLPYGAHIRLKSTYSTAGFSAQNLAIANTLMTYGCFINDTAGSALKIAADDDSRWTSTAQLGNISMANFEVVH